MKGILLAGGTAKRMWPATAAVNKHLLTVFDKPLIFYSLSLLMQAGIRDILLVTNPPDVPLFRRILGNGERFGARIDYAAQARPDGIAAALLLGRDFIGQEGCALVLGDNLLLGPTVAETLGEASRVRAHEAAVFAAHVPNPTDYGVLCLGPDGRPLDIVEKPAVPPSSFAVPGIYFYGTGVLDVAASLTPSERGEHEISDVNANYVRRGRCNVHRLGPEFTWLDVGTPERFLEAATFVASLYEQAGTVVGCPEEIGLQNGWISSAEIARSAGPHASLYAAYLERIISGRKLGALGELP
ncbi:sugar phosphate nucleotidyltransferase [Sorangium sp. So ce281]|uniref:sugar nucleotidyltransferase n=1 Tax=unclassified Sorangium TaxID=2621164 RepID=UPI003F62F222